MTPTRCEGMAHLIAGGRVVGSLRCELDAGHELATRRRVYPQGRDIESSAYDITESGVKQHVATLHWEDGEVIIEDPDAEPTVDVPLIELPPCDVCGRRHAGPGAPGVCDE